MRKYDFITHLKFTFWYLFKVDKSGTKCLYCQNCNGIMFDIVKIVEDKQTSYKAVYKCRKCGAIVHVSEDYTIY